MKSHLHIACLFVFVGLAATARGSTQAMICIAIDSAGNLYIYIADGFAGAIRKLSPDGVISTVIGLPMVGLRQFLHIRWGTSASATQPCGVRPQ